MLEQGLLDILEKVYKKRGFDFREYKETSLSRRIERRLRATKAESYQQYVEIMDSDPNECDKLVDDLTIQVTEFFRNAQAWQILGQKVLPEIIRKKREDAKTNKDTKPALRVWSAGCATGQEVYSVAILIDKVLEERRSEFEVDIRGTDIDTESLLKAKQVEYMSDTAKTVPQDIRNEYFTPSGNFRMKSHIMDCVHFESHDLVLDKPLKQMDLIICRNVAIYFNRALQDKIFMNFCAGLNEGGFLFLGKAETLTGPGREKFTVIDKPWRIYRKEMKLKAYAGVSVERKDK